MNDIEYEMEMDEDFGDSWYPVLKFLAASFLLALSICFNVRPLCLIFLGLFFFFLLKTQCSVQSQTAPKLQSHFELMIECMILFRRYMPGLFCAVSTVCLAALAVVGHLVPGSTLVLCFCAITSTVYIFSQVNLKELRVFLPGGVYQDSDEEFLLEENEPNLFVLERAGDMASLTLHTDDSEYDEDESDEIPMELLMGDFMRESDWDSTGDEQDDLLPVPVSGFNNSSPTTDTIAFKKSHFKRDSSLSPSSSSSEESLSKGLLFPDHTTVDGPSKSKNTVANPLADCERETNDLITMAVKTETQSLVANSSSLIPTLMTGLVQSVLGIGSGAWSTQSEPIHDPTDKNMMTGLDSSDETDFELIEEDDCE